MTDLVRRYSIDQAVTSVSVPHRTSCCPFSFLPSDTFSYMQEQATHALLYGRSVSQFVCKPDEGDQELLVRPSVYATGDEALVFPVGLTHLPFHSVALHGTLEMLFRHADQHLYRRLCVS